MITVVKINTLMASASDKFNSILINNSLYLLFTNNFYLFNINYFVKKIRE